MPDSKSSSLSAHLEKVLPGTDRQSLRDSVLPTLLHSITSIAKCLRSSLNIQQAGSTNNSGDNQLNVDLATNEIIHAAVRTCPSIVAASSEEDDGENEVMHDDSSNQSHGPGAETYTVAFDPLDGSSIIPANWTVGTIIGIWDCETALNEYPKEKQIAAILGVLGPRTTAIIALRVPGSTPACFEVGLSDENSNIEVLRPEVRFAQVKDGMTRYFAPANLRAAHQSKAYASLINYFIEKEYTLRYSGGLVPDIVHALVKGHGVYISPVTEKSKAKLRKLYELAPIALIVECAGGKAVDPSNGKDILETSIETVDDKAGLVCGTSEEVDMVMKSLAASEA
ncbi:sedoheptulose-1,7-bisphosphatase [Lophiotrema nucula]|uniref:Sedoheptulose-1,7-bisphosphatase n=1 Tax=Lophiotrema nucula TaxID=690887 RepID=A0A6A5ZIZ2_9PLEO|nr:sedoheptulose-1,7-bisphosphatase [Lophiotrema nucula]